MPRSTAPGLGLAYGWALGESGPDVKLGLDTNFLTTSILLNLSVKSRVTALPGSPANGDRYIVPAGDGANPNKVAARVQGAWVYLTPQRNWVARVEDEFDAEYVFSGTAWAQPATSGGSGPAVATTGLQTGPNNVTTDFDFLTLTIPATKLSAGMLLDAAFTGTQSQSAATQNLTFYAKINDGTPITIGAVGTGSAAQSYRAISGRAILSLVSLGATGSFLLGGDLAVNSLAPVSSNSASPVTVDTTTQLKITLGLRRSVANAANFETVTTGFIRRAV